MISAMRWSRPPWGVALVWLLAALGRAQQTPTIETIRLEVGELAFNARAAGPRDGELVLLLHGFPQTSFSWRAQLVALAAAGYRAVAPDQRGYSPDARPMAVESYAMPHLVADVVGMLDSLDRARCHLVGHDWGAAVAWSVAIARPEQVSSLTILSTPHPGAMTASWAEAGSEQAQRSSYMAAFAAPGAAARMTADDAAWLRGALAPIGLTDKEVEVYVEVLGEEAAMAGALRWYQALLAGRDRASAAAASASPPPAVRVPTLYVYGADDPYFSLAAARASARFVSGAYRFELLPGEGHWLPETAAARVAELLLAHLGPTTDTGGK